MAVNIDRLSFQMEADVSQFEEGMRLSRKELRAVNAAMRKSEEPAEKLARDINALEEAVAAGGAGAEEYRKRLERLRKKQEDMQNEQSGLNAEMKDAQRIIERTKTETEQYNEAADRAADLLDKGRISATQYRREIDRMERELGGAEKEQHQVNEEMRRAKAITNQVETASEKYAREVRELNGLLARGRLSQTHYNRALSQSKRELNQQRAAVAANIPIVGNMASGMLAGGAAVAGVGIAVAGLTAGLRVLERVATASLNRVASQMEEIDELAKQSRFLGLAVNDLQAMRLAGEEFAGLEFRQVDVGLQRLIRRLSEAAAGTGEAKAAFKELNLDAKALAELPTGEALLQVADALSQVDDEGERLRLAFKLLDSEGARLALAFADGGASIEQMRKVLKELGLEVSDFEAEQVEAANDALGRMQKALDGLGRTAALEFAPNIEAAALAVQQLASDLRDADSDVGKWGNRLLWLADLFPSFTGIGDVAELVKANEEFAAQIERQRKLQEELDEIQGKDGGPPMVSEEEMERVAKEEQAMASAISKIEEMRTELEKLQGIESPIVSTDDVAILEEAKRLTEEIEKQRKDNAAEDRLRAMREEMHLMEMTANEAERYKFARDGATEAQQKQFELLQEEKQAMERGKELEEAFAEPAEALKRELADLKKLEIVGAIDTSTFERAAQQAAAQFREAMGQNEVVSQPSAIEEGSQEAFKFLTGQQNDRQQQQLAKLEEQRLLQQAMVDAQKQLNRKVDKLQPIGRAR